MRWRMRGSVWPIVAALSAVIAMGAQGARADNVNIIDLTQTGCQFLEPEQGYDHGFDTKQSTDCVLINAETAVDRLEAVSKGVEWPVSMWFQEGC